MMEMDWSIF